MTVLIAIAVKPRNGLKPYVLMGSDSLKLNADFIGNEIKIKSRDEDSDKIFEINDKLISISGKVDINFHNKFLEFIKENDCDLSNLTELSFSYLKESILKDNYADARCAVYIGCCTKSIPRIACIKIKKLDIENAISKIIEPDQDNIVAESAGSISQAADDDLAEQFGKKISESKDLNMTSVRKAAEEYLKKAAARYPDRCNQNIKFKRLR